MPERLDQLTFENDKPRSTGHTGQDIRAEGASGNSAPPAEVVERLQKRFEQTDYYISTEIFGNAPHSVAEHWGLETEGAAGCSPRDD